jgi:TPR repeat protein
MAAEQGLAEAQTNLGVMYYKGTGVPQDHVEAYAWWSVAAAGGDADAANNRVIVKESLSGSQLAQGQRRATELLEKHGSK